MIFQHPQVSKTTEILNDLAQINSDRIAGYQLSMSQPENLASELRDAFYTIISDASRFKQQLYLKMKQLEGDVNVNSNLRGNIYGAWADLKVAFGGGSQKSVVASCLYNEEIALHAYRAALSAYTTGVGDEICETINYHETALRENQSLLKSYRNSRRVVDSSMMYFAF